MHVPVKDHHPLQSEIVDSEPGGDGHVVEVAEAEGLAVVGLADAESKQAAE